MFCLVEACFVCSHVEYEFEKVSTYEMKLMYFNSLICDSWCANF